MTATALITTGSARPARPVRGGRRILIWIADHTVLSVLAVLFLAPILFCLLYTSPSPRDRG